MLYLRDDCRVFFELSAEQLRDRFPRQVVRGRSQSSGGDDQIGARKRFANRLCDVRRGICDGDLASNQVAPVRELTANPLLMGIQNAALH